VTRDPRAIDRIAQVLASTGAPGTFATRRTASAGDLHLDVVGVGPIPLPLSSASARRLCGIAHPARYGLRDQTLLDRNVRDTWEIGKRQVKIDERRWRRTLDPELERITRDLGLPEGRTLRAELHNLLVYGPGQFFAAHQDSEKADGMIGTLVVLLPSESKGGALVIEHHDEKISYRGSADRLTLVAFYADCHHAVRPVTVGYRAALTYNLFLDGATQRLPERQAGSPLDTLVDLVRVHFATPRPARGPRWPSEGPPERLVYLLDHEYTQKGLAWGGLKNGDTVRAALLREVADRLDCEIVLALADVHESWSCEDDWGYDGFGYGRRTRRWRYDDYDDQSNENEGDEDTGGGGAVARRGDEDYALIELFDSSIELRHWIAPSGKRVQAISAEVLDDEVCYTKASVEFDPFASEHEGYTGNAGNTVDRWYHRAAVMLWPRTRTFAIRAKASPAWAIREIAKALARSSGALARKRVGDVLPFWSRAAANEQEPAFVDALLRVAAELSDPELAAALVEPLRVECVTPRMAPRCADLLARYGPTWCGAAFERWISHSDGGYEDEPRAAWIASLPELCGPLHEAGGGDAIELVRRLSRSQWTWLDERIRRLCDSLPSSAALRGLVGLSEAVVGVLATAAIAGDRELQTLIIERVSPEQGYPMHGAIAVLRSGKARGAATLGLGRLHEACAHTLSRLLSAPARGSHDWSIAAPLHCTCELCKRLARFLLASNEQQLDWPLAKDRRAHVHQTITHHELPVTHVTRRGGSPHVLVLTKTKALFAREAAERKTWTSDLAWLTQTARSFGAPQPTRRLALAASADGVEARPRRSVGTRR
jgi:hypothetical protein